MRSAQSLCEELAGIQAALAGDALEQLPQMVDAYHFHLNVWMSSATSETVEAVLRLRNMHWQTLAQLQQRQQRLRLQMQAERHGERAARAYLSSSPS